MESLTPSQLRSLQVLVSRHPSPVALSTTTGYNHISHASAHALHDAGLVRIVEQFYPSAWVVALTATGHQYAKSQGITKLAKETI